MTDPKKRKKALLYKIIVPGAGYRRRHGFLACRGCARHAVNENPDFALHADDSFDLEQLKSYGLPIVIEFGNDFCAPCWEMKPIVEELNEELRGKAIIKYVDTYHYPEIKAGFPISAIPTQVFYDSEGNPYDPENPNHPWMNPYNDPETGLPEFTTHLGPSVKGGTA